MNKLRFIMSGLVAGLFINVSEYFLNVTVLQVPRESMVFWVAYGFVLGFLVSYLYAFLVDSQDSPGPKTAATAGIIVCIVAAGLNMWVMGFSVIALVWILVEMTVAGLLVGRLYSEAQERQPPAGIAARRAAMPRTGNPPGDTTLPTAALPEPRLPPPQHFPRAPDLLLIPRPGGGFQQPPIEVEVRGIAVHRLPVKPDRL